MSFTENLSGQNKEDVLNSTLLAQLAANKKYDRKSQHDEWYMFYMKVLENVGLAMHGLRRVSNLISTSKSRARLKFQKWLSSCSCHWLEKTIPTYMKSLVKKTLAALQKSSSYHHVVWLNSSSAKSGNFQIVPCTLDKSEQVTVGFIGCYFEASNVNYRFLFFT